MNIYPLSTPLILIPITPYKKDKSTLLPRHYNEIDFDHNTTVVMSKRTRDYDSNSSPPHQRNKKKRQHLIITEKVEPSHGELIDLVNTWFDEYDPHMRETLPSLCTYIEMDMTCKAAVYYEKQHNNILLESDLSLCKHVCPIQILHIVARLWSIEPHTYHYSREQHYFFHVIKNKLTRNLHNKFNAFMTRLVDLSASYTHGNGEDVMARHIPIHQQIALVTFYYSNLHFMGRDRHSGDYHIACDNIKILPSFNNIVSRIRPNVYDDDSDDSTEEEDDPRDRHGDYDDDEVAFKLFIVDARDTVINAWNTFLDNRFRGGNRYDIFQKIHVALGWRKKVKYECVTPF